MHAPWSVGKAVPADFQGRACAPAATLWPTLASLGILSPSQDEIGAWADAVAWKQEHPQSRLAPLWGCEITTKVGHILAYIFQPPYPTRRFPAFRSFAASVRRIREAGGVCIK